MAKKKEQPRLDALGQPIKIGSKYGFSNDSNGLTTVTIGILTKINEKSVRIDVTSKKSGIYNDPLTEVKDPKGANVKWTKLFPIIDHQALEELTDWCHNTANGSTRDTMYEIVERL